MDSINYKIYYVIQNKVCTRNSSISRVPITPLTTVISIRSACHRQPSF
jgi:hypothetical protein